MQFEWARKQSSPLTTFFQNLRFPQSKGVESFLVTFAKTRAEPVMYQRGKESFIKLKVCTWEDWVFRFINKYIKGQEFASKKEGESIYVLWNDQRSHLCYALHRVPVCLLSFLHFSAMRFASLYRRERPFESERASNRKDSPSRELQLLENGEIISERRTNDDLIF